MVVLGVATASWLSASSIANTRPTTMPIDFAFKALPLSPLVSVGQPSPGATSMRSNRTIGPSHGATRRIGSGRRAIDGFVGLRQPSLQEPPDHRIRGQRQGSAVRGGGFLHPAE